MVLSTFGRIAAVKRPASSAGGTSAQQNASSGFGGATAARVLVYHQEDTQKSLCEDLVITAAGVAIYSACGNGVEKQYSLSETERQQLQAWISKFQAVNYHPYDASQAGGRQVQLRLNGQGSQQATELEAQQMIDFAVALDAKIVSQT